MILGMIANLFDSKERSDQLESRRYIRVLQGVEWASDARIEEGVMMA